MLAGLLLAVYAIERARAAWWWILVAVAGALYALVVKGVFALLAPVLAGFWLWSRPRQGTIGVAGWCGLAAIVVMVPVTAWGYERAYHALTDQSFLDYYLGARITLEGSHEAPWPFPLDKVGNLAWYLGRVLWYAAPWSLAAWRPFCRLRARLASGPAIGCASPRSPR